MKDAFLLKSLEVSNQGLWPTDKVIILREGTNDGGGDHNIDLTGVVRAGAEVFSCQLAKATLSASAILDSNAAVPGVSADVVTLILVNQPDLYIHGES